MNCNDRITYDKNCNIIIREENNYDNNYVYVYILQLNKTKGLVTQVFIKTQEDQEVKFNHVSDGFYTIVTLKVPNGRNAGEYYYYNDNFYHYFELIDLQTLVEVNPNVSHLDINYEYYFLICRLKECYINICQKIFDQVSSLNCNKSNIDQNLIYKRDLIWSALNVIKFMIEKDLLEEALRLLERITGCNGLCENICNTPNHTNCGCK